MYVYNIKLSSSSVVRRLYTPVIFVSTYGVQRTLQWRLKIFKNLFSCILCLLASSKWCIMYIDLHKAACVNFGLSYNL
jgi:hypothetical protein